MKASDSKLWKELAKLWVPFQRNVQHEELDEGSTSIVWCPSSSGDFTVASYYKHFTCPQDRPRQHIWRLIWKLQVPERIRNFTWLAAHGRLTTSDIVSKWDHTSGLCHLCSQEREDQTHALRDCPYASQIWRNLLPRHCWSKFFREDKKGWMRANLVSYDKITSINNWPELFATCAAGTSGDGGTSKCMRRGSKSLKTPVLSSPDI